jgi:hypothetical protein
VESRLHRKIGGNTRELPDEIKRALFKDIQPIVQLTWFFGWRYVHALMDFLISRCGAAKRKHSQR